MSRKTMLAAVLHGPEDLRVQEVAIPPLAEGEVLLRSRAAAICGTDVRIFRHGHSRLPANTKRILGHEMAGEVIEVGKGVSGIAEGARVSVAPNFGCGSCRMCQRGWHHLCPDYGAIGLTVDGGFAEYVRVPAVALRQGCLLEIPAELSFAQAALNEPLACVYNGLRRCPVEPGDVVLIVGAGPAGLMLLQMARLAGAAQTIVANRSPRRLELARRLGAGATIVTEQQDLIRAVKEATDGYGADVIFTACPSPQVQEQVLEVAADHARINFFGGLPKREEHIRFNSNRVHYGELTITGSHGCCSYHCRKALELQASKLVDLTPLISNIFSLREAGQAMAAALAGEGFKTVIQPERTGAA